MAHSWAHEMTGQRPTDPAADAALTEAAHRRVATQQKWPRIHRLTESVTQMRKANHLSERMRAAFEGEAT